MEVQNGTFYMARVSGQDTLHQTEEEAIEQLRGNVDGVDPEDGDVSLVEVAVDDGDWTIKEMPWQRVAIKLLANQ